MFVSWKAGERGVEGGGRDGGLWQSIRERLTVVPGRFFVSSVTLKKNLDRTEGVDVAVDEAKSARARPGVDTFAAGSPDVYLARRRTAHRDARAQRNTPLVYFWFLVSFAPS